MRCDCGQELAQAPCEFTRLELRSFRGALWRLRTKASLSHKHTQRLLSVRREAYPHTRTQAADAHPR